MRHLAPVAAWLLASGFLSGAVIPAIAQTPPAMPTKEQLASDNDLVPARRQTTCSV